MDVTTTLPYTRSQLAVARAILTDYEEGKWSADELAAEYDVEAQTVALVLAGAAHFREGLEACMRAVGKVEFLADDEAHEKKNAQDAQDACDEVVAITTKYVPGLDGEDRWHEWPALDDPNDPTRTLVITLGVGHSAPRADVIAQTASTMRTRDNALGVALDVLEEEVRKHLPPEHVCSLVIHVDNGQDRPYARSDYKEAPGEAEERA
jgi:hypothetical protein